MRILLFTGKGGVGKTTAAAATALRLADRGTKTLLLSTDSAHSLADALGTDVTGEPTAVVRGLAAVQIDSQRRFEAAWGNIQRYLLDLMSGGPAAPDPITADELTVLPGIDEVFSLLAVRDLAASGDWDVLVVDCAPTAETLRLLALPEALSWYLQRVFPAHRRLARGVRPMAALLGRAEVIPPDELFDGLLRLTEDLASVRALLEDPGKTTVRLVITPESMVLAEARRTFTALALYGYLVDGVIANRVFPSSTNAWQRSWATAQRRILDEARESFAGLDVQTLPYCSGEPVGLDALRDLADELYGAMPGSDPVATGVAEPLLRVEPDDEEFVLHLQLPLATRGSVEAARAGDELVVTVGAHRRVLSLPSVLRRCEVVGGQLAAGELVVRFRRDPQLWPTSLGGQS